MDLNDLHPVIKEFIGNLSADNYKTHTLGEITVYDFKFPKFRVFFWQQMILFSFIVGKYLTEDEVVRRINMKIFW